MSVFSFAQKKIWQKYNHFNNLYNTRTLVLMYKCKQTCTQHVHTFNKPTECY